MRFILKNILIFLFVSVLFKVVAAQGVEYNYGAVKYGMVEGSKVTSVCGGKRFNEFFGMQFCSKVDSTTSRRNGKPVIIESMYSVGVIGSIPVTDSSWVDLSYSHAALARSGDSSPDGSVFGVGYRHEVLRAYHIFIEYREVIDVSDLSIGINFNF